MPFDPLGTGSFDDVEGTGPPVREAVEFTRIVALRRGLVPAAARERALATARGITTPAATEDTKVLDE